MIRWAKSVLLLTLLACLALLISGCAVLRAPGSHGEDFDTSLANPAPLEVSGTTVYGTNTAPLSYRTAIRPRSRDGAIRDIHARSCQTGIFFDPSVLLKVSVGSLGVKYGDGGYAEALRLFHNQYKDVNEIFDVKVDYEITSVLGIFNRLCLLVDAKAIVPRALSKN